MKIRPVTPPRRFRAPSPQCWSKARHEAGAAMVEFAIVAVVLFTIILMIMQGGLVMGAWLNITNAAREGARYAAPCYDRPVEPCDEAEIEAIVKSRLTGLVDQGNADFDVVVDGDADNGTVKVTVTCSVIGFVPFLPSSIESFNLTGQSTMRIEN